MDDTPGQKILVTRPTIFAEALMTAMTQHGFHPIHLPGIDFELLPLHNKADFCYDTRFDWCIFISPFAVHAFHTHMQQSRLSISAYQYAAIGLGTAKTMQQFKMRVDIMPEQDEWSSESLLSLTGFKQIEHKKIAIVRGQGGRDLLDQTLSKRGASVWSCVLYRRILPIIDMAPYRSLLDKGRIDALVATSGEIIANLQQLFGPSAAAQLQKLPIVVPSERIKILAQNLGFQTIWVAHNTSTQAIIHTLTVHRT